MTRTPPDGHLEDRALRAGTRRGRLPPAARLHRQPVGRAPLGEALAARGLYVRAPRLPGHGTTPEALLRREPSRLVAGRRRRPCTRCAASGACSSAGLSMGALLGLRLAAELPRAGEGAGAHRPRRALQGADEWLLKSLRQYRAAGAGEAVGAQAATDLTDPAVLAERPSSRPSPRRLKDLWEVQDAAWASAPGALPRPGGGGRAGPRGGSRWWSSGSPRSSRAPRRSGCVSLQEGYHIVPRDTGGPRLASEAGDFLQRLRQPRSNEDGTCARPRASLYGVYEPVPGSAMTTPASAPPRRAA